MAFRLSQGNGEAYYEIGVHDSGKMIGIEQEEILETMIVLFHISV
jgi:GTPase